MICTPHQILFGVIRSRKSDGRVMLHVWEGDEYRVMVEKKILEGKRLIIRPKHRWYGS
jgi:hypothetical protein